MLQALLNVAFFNFVMLVIFAIMGVHLYGFDTEAFDADGGPPRDNFHSFGRAFLTCFIILTGEVRHGLQLQSLWRIPTAAVS